MIVVKQLASRGPKEVVCKKVILLRENTFRARNCRVYRGAVSRVEGEESGKVEGELRSQVTELLIPR
jgi:hypothetical protein